MKSKAQSLTAIFKSWAAWFLPLVSSPDSSLKEKQPSKPMPIEPDAQTNLNLRKVLKMTAMEEGRRSKPYKDSLGYWTVGIGHLMDDRKGGYLPMWAQRELDSGGELTDATIDRLFSEDIARFDKELRRRAPWVNGLDEVRYGCLLDMAFQLGVTGLLGFVNTLDMVKIGNYAAAADGMKHSKWYSQTPNRAERRMAQMRSGEWGL